MRRDLPIPASPETSTTCPSPALARSQRRSRGRISSSRPTSGSEPCRMQRLEPIVDRTQPNHFPRAYRRRKALDLDSTEITTLEQARQTGVASYRRSAAFRAGHCLEPGGQIWAFHPQPHAPARCRGRSDRRRLPCRLQYRSVLKALRARLEICEADPLHAGETSAQRPFGILFVCMGVAEIYKHAVTHVLGDETAEFGDFLGVTAA